MSRDERARVPTDDGDASVLWRLRREDVWRDAPLLALVPAVLVAAFALPPDAKRLLALEYADPTLLTAFTSHFVHFSVRHLLINLLGSLIVVPTGYLLSVLSGRRQQFLVAFVSFVGAFPFALSGLNLLVLHRAVGIGFSGIVLAFVGYLGIVLLDFCGQRYAVSLDGTRSAWLFFLALALIAYDLPVYGPTIAVAALLASTLFVADLIPLLDRERLVRAGSIAASDVGGNLVVLGAAVFLIYPAVSVTTAPATANGVINVYSHLLGFCLGYITTYLMTVLDGF